MMVKSLRGFTGGGWVRLSKVASFTERAADLAVSQDRLWGRLGAGVARANGGYVAKLERIVMAVHALNGRVVGI
jgi:hypothetical protein